MSVTVMAQTWHKSFFKFSCGELYLPSFDQSDIKDFVSKFLL